MAKLSAHGRREWLRFRHVSGMEFAYMSDGTVLRKEYRAAWHRVGRYAVHRPLSSIRGLYGFNEGWTEVNTQTGKAVSHASD